MTTAHRHLLSRVGVLVVATIVLDLAASVAIYLLERRVPGTAIRTLGDALFWTSTQLTTVSSQLPNPVSPGARVLDVALQAYAVGAVAILAGSFGAFFHGRSMERGEAPSEAAAQRPENRVAATPRAARGSS
jgi:hypothetical protein